MTAREDILASIRNALEVQASDPAGSHARIVPGYNRIGKLGREACLEFFIDRLVDYDTEITVICEYKKDWHCWLVSQKPKG